MQPLHTSLRVVPSVDAVIEPIDLETTKKFIRLYTNFEDDLVASLITTARSMCESYLSRALVPQFFEWTMKPMYMPRSTYSGWQNYGFWSVGNTTGFGTFELPRSPVHSVESVTVRDYNGDDVLLDETMYTINLMLEPARLSVNWNLVNDLSPVQIIYPLQHVVVNFVAGYDELHAMPQAIKQSMLLMVNYLNERRGDEIDQPEMPKAAYALLDPYKITFFGSGV